MQTDNACTGLGTLAARRFNPVMPSAVRFSKGPYLALIAEELGRSRRRSRVAGRYNLVLCPACASREPARSACTGGSSGPYSTKVQQPTLCVPKTSSTSCDQAIFVDQATDARLSSDAVLTEIDRLGERFQRRGAVQGAVRPVLIVVDLVLAQDPPQMSLVPDEGLVQL
jgi:hypothetical protein